jgi:hypothetical protein
MIPLSSPPNDYVAPGAVFTRVFDRIAVARAGTHLLALRALMDAINALAGALGS